MRRGGEEGFTLVEVLAAMVILAVGLLALEALGIGAARSISTANRQSELAVVATGAMEDRLQDVRDDPSTVTSTGEVCGVDTVSGYYVCWEVRVMSPPGQMALVTVRVQKQRDDDDPFELSSYFFHPDIP